MGGSCDPDDKDGISYEVMTVNLETGDVGQAEDTIYGTNVPAAASSVNMIALCGGESANKSLNYCQLYSQKNNRCACHIIDKSPFQNNGHCQVAWLSEQSIKGKRHEHVRINASNRCRTPFYNQ